MQLSVGGSVNRARLILAFTIAPLAPSIYFWIMMRPTDQKFILLMLAYSIFFSYIPSLLLGIPAVRYLMKIKRLNMVNMVLFGAIVGTLIFYMFTIVFTSMLGSTLSLIPEIKDLSWGALIGASISISFGLIAGIPFIGAPHNDSE